ncbi:MAG: hypothetical protein ACK502_10220 [Alphaproteobacteria bacterium]
MSKIKTHPIAGLNLSLYIGDKKDDSIHLVCNGYNALDESGRKMLEEIAGLINDAIETAAHTKVTSLESPHEDMSRYDISATKRDIPPKILFDIADYTLGKLLPQRVERAKYKISAVSALRASVREADAHELKTLRTALRGTINTVFSNFTKTAETAEESAPDEPITLIQLYIAKKLTDNTRDKLIHREILDYYLGDRVIESLLQPLDSRRPGENADKHVARTVGKADRQLKQKIDAFLMEENIGKKAATVRGYLAGELTTAIEQALETVNKAEKTKAKAR